MSYEIGFFYLLGRADGNARPIELDLPLQLCWNKQSPNDFTINGSWSTTFTVSGTLPPALALSGYRFVSHLVAMEGTSAVIRCLFSNNQAKHARIGAAAAAAAAVVAHLRCNWEFADDSAAPRPPAACDSCGAVGCNAGCGAAGAAADSAPTSILTALLEDLRPPKARKDLEPVPKLLPRLSNPGDLPADILDAILTRLDPASLRAAAATCRGMRARALCLSPGLHLQPHEHQRDALAWMRLRERPPPSLPAPLWRQLRLRAPPGAPPGFVWAHELSGELCFEEPQRALDARGGLFCDEPGLGKTVTIIALLLATRGIMATPPEGALVGGGCGDGGGGGHSDGGGGGGGMPLWYDPTVGGSTASGRARRASAAAAERCGHFAAVEAARDTGEDRRDSQGFRVNAQGGLLSAARSAKPEALDGGGAQAQPPRGAVWLSTATLIAVPPVLLAHWLQQLAPLLDSGRLTAAVADASAVLPEGCSAVRLPDLNDVDPQDLATSWDIVLVPLSRFSAEHKSPTSSLMRVHWLRMVLDEGHSLGASLGITSKLAVACALRAERRWVVTGTPTPAAAMRGQLQHMRPLLQFIREGAWGSQDRFWSRAVQRPLEAAPAVSAGPSAGGSGVPSVSSVSSVSSVHGGSAGSGGFAADGDDEAGSQMGAAGALGPADAAAEAEGAMDAAAGEVGAGVSLRDRSAAAARLSELLRRVMARTRKDDIRLRPVLRSEVLLSFNRTHAELHNDIIAHVRRALLLADWGDPSHEQSLLNGKNAKLGRATVINLREACCVAGRYPTVTLKSEVDEALEMLEATMKGSFGFAGDRLRNRLELLRTTLNLGRGACDACGLFVTMPLVTPCGHVVCCGCIGGGVSGARRVGSAADSSPAAAAPAAATAAAVEPPTAVGADGAPFEKAPTGCVVCHAPFRMQPPTPRPDNPAPRQAVPEDLIELQPAYEQLAWQVDWTVERQGHSSKVAYLLRRLVEMGALPEPPTEEELEEERALKAAMEAASPAFNGGGAAAAGGGGGGGGGGGPAAPAAPSAPAMPAAPTAPGVASPGPMLAPRPRVRQLRWRPALSGVVGVPKVIVYSGFATHLHTVDTALWSTGAPYATLRRVGYSRKDKEAALLSFRFDPHCRVLLLDRQGAEGLDLSFASAVFLCEPLLDAALEQQVVSRAHRMGQKGLVRVEVLAMADTAEQRLLDLRREGGGAGGPAAAEALSRRRLLETLRFAPVPMDVESNGGPDGLGGGEAGSSRRAAAGGVDSAAAVLGLGSSRVQDAPSLAPKGSGRGSAAHLLSPLRRAGSSGGGGSSAAAAAAAEAAAEAEMATFPPIGPRFAAAASAPQARWSQPAPADAEGQSMDWEMPDGFERQREGQQRPQQQQQEDRRRQQEQQQQRPAQLQPRRVMFADPMPAAAVPWTIRLRGPHVPPHASTLTLPSGGATQLSELGRRAAAASGLAARTLVISAGYPPRLLAGDGGGAGGSDGGGAGGSDDGAATLAAVGLSDRDGVSIEGTAPAVGDVAAAGALAARPRHAAAAAAAAAPRASPAASPGVSRVATRGSLGTAEASPPAGAARRGGRAGGRSGGRFAGRSRRVGSGPSRAAMEEADEMGSSLAQATLSAGFAPDTSWLLGSGGGGGNANILAGALIGAAAGGGGWDAGDGGALAALLRADLRKARAQRDDEAEGVARAAAAAAGRCQFAAMPDGRTEVRFWAPGPQGAAPRQRTDCVRSIPQPLLPAVLGALAGLAAADANTRENLAAERMAIVSPFMFWAVVRWGAVGPGKSFAEAMAELAPAVDWGPLGVGQRERVRPSKYGEYVIGDDADEALGLPSAPEGDADGDDEEADEEERRPRKRRATAGRAPRQPGATKGS